MFTPPYGEVPVHAARAVRAGAVQVSKNLPEMRVAEAATG
jgi:hypothetical protein